MNEVYITEGSDWFWWYGDSHFAPNKYDFDDLFRWHIGQIYGLLGLEIPDNVKIPINLIRRTSPVEPPKSYISPHISSSTEEDEQWNYAGVYNAKTAMSAMHQIGGLLEKIYFGRDEDSLYLKITFEHEPEPQDMILLMFENYKINIKKSGFEFCSDKPVNLYFLNYYIGKSALLALPIEIFGKRDENHLKLKLMVATYTKDGEIDYPRQGFLELQM